jgi:hypothetical protein
MIDDEFNDPELARRLSRLAGSTPDVAPAYVGVQRRVATVRRRRVAMISAAGVSALVLGVFALRPQSGADEINVAGESDNGSLLNTIPDINESSPSTAPGVTETSEGPETTLAGSATTVVTSTTPATTGDAGAPGVTDAGPLTSVGSAGPGVTRPGAPAPTNLPVAPVPTQPRPPVTTRPPTTTRPPAPATTVARPPATTVAPAPVTTPAPAPIDVTRSQSSGGGSITVRLSGGVLSLVSSTPSSGFEKDVRSSGPSRVEVRFESDNQMFRIRATISGGDISFEVTEESDGGGGDDGGSDTTVGEDHSDDSGPPESTGSAED